MFNMNVSSRNMDIPCVEDNAIRSPDNVTKSILFLTETLSWVSIPPLPTSKCFTIPSEDHTAVEHNWTHAIPISKEEFYAQIIYELATLYFYRQNYTIAKQYFFMCLQNVQKLGNVSGFVVIEADMLHGYLNALDGESGKESLTQQLHLSVVNHYTVSS